MSSPNKLSGNNESQDASWDVLMKSPSTTPQLSEIKATPSPSALVQEYGDRVIYTDKNGKEQKITLNPWGMKGDMFKAPENLMILGQTLTHMAKKWKEGNSNPSEQVRQNDKGEIERTGWDKAARVSADSMLGNYIEQLNHPETGGRFSFDRLTPDLGTLMEKYGERVIYTDETGKEEKMTLNPYTMMEDAMDNPDDMRNTGVLMKKMATRWHNDERNPGRRRYVDENGEVTETGWDKATRVDDSSALGRYIKKALKKQEEMFKPKTEGGSRGGEDYFI
ncbi:hypothetical protein IKF84_02590 [Candidatus Saccharibacteria bacterium]|nr:hypothetical protein [Candidatus Saccharibacteria bacterium]